MRPTPRAALLFALLLATTVTFAQTKKATHAAGPGPDKALLQKIWDGWSSLNIPGQAQFYAQGAHTFFDITPLKYSSWDEYQKGVTGVLAGYQSGRCTVNDDAEIHNLGDTAWGSATVKYDLVTKSGKHDMGNFRWTFIFEKHDGKWLLVHEHVSEPLA
jgi:ketosteroid isomerase-like protein